MRYYIYALIDPRRRNDPFYIGKGLDSRLQSHFKEAAGCQLNASQVVLGCDTESVVDVALTKAVPERIQRILDIQQLGFDHTDIARIVARRLDERMALTIESFLIHRVHGLEQLTNSVQGHHHERFRKHGVETWIDGFDFERPNSDRTSNARGFKQDNYYVYTLRNPGNHSPFYIGKGIGKRADAHFVNARRLNARELGDAADHLVVLRRLLDQGYDYQDIARIEAKQLFEQEAFAIEALLLKYVHGFASVNNRVAGHHEAMFRAKGDWQRRRGFDLPYICDPGAAVDRTDKKEGMIGEGLDTPLLAIADAFPEIRFDEPTIKDASELAIEAKVALASIPDAARIKVFIRKSRLQIELRWRTVAERQCIQSHFKLLGAYPLRRRDDVFLPTCWKGTSNMTDDLEETTRRLERLLEVTRTDRPSLLSQEAKRLLE